MYGATDINQRACARLKLTVRESGVRSIQIETANMIAKTPQKMTAATGRVSEYPDRRASPGATDRISSESSILHTPQSTVWYPSENA
jgi:hypothetical protein